MSEVVSMLKAKAPCEGNQERCGVSGCPKFGTLGRAARDGTRRVAGCGDAVARGRRNRKQGLAKQSTAARRLGLVGGSDEERWASVFANEVKSGKQVGPAWTWWLRAEAQVVAAEPDFGGRRKPVRVVLKPPGSSDGVVMVRESTWAELITPALLHFYGEA